MSTSSSDGPLCYLQYLGEEDAGSGQPRAGLRIRGDAGFVWLQVELEHIHIFCKHIYNSSYFSSKLGDLLLTDFNLFLFAGEICLCIATTRKPSGIQRNIN